MCPALAKGQRELLGEDIGDVLGGLQLGVQAVLHLMRGRAPMGGIASASARAEATSFGIRIDLAILPAPFRIVELPDQIHVSISSRTLEKSCIRAVSDQDPNHDSS